MSLALPPPVDRKILCDTLYNVFPAAAVFSVIPGYTRREQSSGEEDPCLPPLISSLYKEKHRSCGKEELLQIAKCKLKDIKCSKQEADFLERQTRNQGLSTLWHDHRVGRVTASVFGRVAKLRQSEFSTSLVKTIMGYTKPSPFIPAIKWGRDNEDAARQQYRAFMEAKHRSFFVRSAGLCVNTAYAYLGASPDGIVNCLCCGEGLLEIKCPFKHRNVDPVNITDDTFFLHFTEDGLHLKLDHSYYYQVQGQLAVCEKDYCDFVCWTKQGMHVERIARNEHFFNMFAPKLEEVFFQYILPEVMTKNLLASDKPGSSSSSSPTRPSNYPPPPPVHPSTPPSSPPSDADRIYCVCEQKEFGTMIACDSPTCPIEWFHFSCVGLTNEPEGEWFCDNCKY